MINIGDKIFLALHEEGEEKARFRCRLVDQSEGVFIVDYPIDEKTNRTNYFYQGTQFRAWFLGSDEAIYLFETELLHKQPGNVPSLVLKDPGKDNYLRIQRRKYVRVEAATDVAVYPITENRMEPFTSVSVDVSGGGLAVVMPENHGLKAGDRCQVWVVVHFLDETIDYVNAVCEFVRIHDGHNGGRDKGSLKFIDIKEQDRQKLIRYCFDRQRFLRQKEQLD
ncbi:flagellar brake domain-containing protein [Texcoconibacillus texcoconensis]|uniref:C-di-GMP-binding flagellar brake protein YcgR n=1 Tax=Texcoconibacillus texcoconensis TaxID=1095777 RepID=A0A840QNJ9_9BACI|nr:c-di-GMP-binding flagellar brake protein YcgR [Texcoconibacillus texcoconensis]